MSFTAADLLTGGATPLTTEPGLRALDVDGKRVEYVVLGLATAPPLVILHGGRCSADDWSNVAPVLARTHRVVIADGLVQPFDPWRLWLLLSHLGIQRASFIVHSAGGMTWRAMYRLQPHRISGVVSIDTQGVGQTIVVRLWPHERFSPEAAALYERRRAQMESLKPQHRGDYPSDVNITARNVAYHRATLSPAQLADTRPPPRVVELFAGAVPATPEPIADAGKFITCPVLVIHTGRGKLGPEDITPEWIDQNIQASDVQYEVMREASHWPWLEQPEWFFELVQPFLARCTSPAAV